MGVLFSTIPYKSQYDPDAGEFRNDCGPAALAMILHAYGIPVTTNEVYRRTGASPFGYVSAGQLMRASDTYGISFRFLKGWSMDEMRQSLRSGHSLIALVHYGAWSLINPGVSTQNSFQGPHFVTVVGYDDAHVYVNDPLWRRHRRAEGEHKKWTNLEFHKAWGSAHLDGNPDFCGIASNTSLPVSLFGEQETNLEPPPPPYQIDPVLERRIRAWASYFGIDIPEFLDNPAVVTAYEIALGKWGLRILPHVVTDSDTLGLIAMRYYGDPMKWEVLLFFNGLSHTSPIQDGDILIIPEPLEQPIEIPEEDIPQGRTYNLQQGGINRDTDHM